MTSRKAEPLALARTLCGVVAAVLVAWGLLYNELLLGLLDPSPPLRPTTVEAVRVTQAVLLLSGALLAWLGWRGLALGPLSRLVRRPATPRVLLLVAAIVVPLMLLELSLRPFVDVMSRTTRIFMRDPDRGWKLRPGARDLWGGVPVAINARGLRGPMPRDAKPAGTFRILFLGDSVTFGFRIARDADTFPARVERQLRARWQLPVESINAGVGGYSPWQEHLYLASEGVRFDPDLVVLGFVLNDVTEKLRLVRFGGSDEGHQLAYTTRTWIDRASNHSSILFFIRELRARRLFGGDVQRGAAAREEFEVQTLVRDPYEPRVRKAWDLTLRSVDRIVDLCVARQVPLLLVVFPFTFQFQDPARLSVPQSIIIDYARDRRIPALDLLPALLAWSSANGRSPGDLFFDFDHLTPEGSRVVAEIVTETIANDAARFGRP